MLKNRLWKILVGAFLAALLLPVLYHYQLKFKTNRLRTEMKSKGVLKQISQLTPQPVPVNQDGLPVFLKAYSLINTNKGVWDTNPPHAQHMVAPGKAMIGATQAQIRDGKVTNTWDDLQTSLDQNTQALDLLQKLNERPRMNFNLPYQKGFYDGGFFKNLHFAELRNAATLLNTAAMMDLHQRNTEAALKKIHSALLLADALKDQRLIISELVRIAVLTITHTTTWEFLQSNQATDPQLASLQASWEHVDCLLSHKESLLMEVACDNSMLETWRNSISEMKKALGIEQSAKISFGIIDSNEPNLSDRLKLSSQIFLWRYWWSYTDELRSLRGNEALVDSANEIITNGAFVAAVSKQEARLDSLGINQLRDSISGIFSEDTDFHSLSSSSVQTLAGVVGRTARAETMKRMTVTAIALKRYHLKYGAYPEQLSQLAPEFLKTPPLDPADGKPLRYQLKPNGTILLYSIGEDGVDNGGNPEPLDKKTTSFNWQRSRDWVWPQPASSEEITAWLNRPSK